MSRPRQRRRPANPGNHRESNHDTVSSTVSGGEMKYFLDTEFNGFNGELISLAMVSESGLRELYIATDCWKPCLWVKENVLPIISLADATPFFINQDRFGQRIASFLYDDPMPVIVADWPDDISYFCKALITAPGQMVAIPKLQFHLLRIDAYPTD